MTARTLGELLRHRALEDDAAFAYGVLDERAAVRAQVSYGELYQAALRIATMLHDHLEPGSRIILAYPNGIDFIVAFFGCTLLGLITVPVAMPRRNRENERLKAIVRDAQPVAALTIGGSRELLAAQLRDAGASVVVHATDGAGLQHLAPCDRPHSAAADDIAYLQYTSGSITTPKGVIVTHANVLSNSAVIREVEGNDRASVSLTWLPNFHDMGLVEGILQPLYSGIPGLIMTPAAFLFRPWLWLHAISQHRVTNSGAPNFAYQLCVDKAEESAGAPLDLSTWRVAYNGAEPIRHETLRRFLEVFAPYGFQERAFYPVYGLAEATLVVTSGGREDLPLRLAVDRADLERGRVVCVPDGTPSACTLVASGRILNGRYQHGTEVMIVDPESGEPLPDGTIGEVWLAGPSVASGYWNRPDETALAFGAMTPGRPGATFARTGDLGFEREGWLFLTGRLKDLIISKGRNLYAHDVEWLAGTVHPSVRPWNCAAVPALDAGEDRITVVCEARRHAGPETLESIARAVRSRVANELEVELEDVLFIPAGALPKTSSGKVQRLVCGEMLKSGALPVQLSLRLAEAEVARAVQSPTRMIDELRENLRALLARACETTGIADDVPVREYVNDSLHAVQVCHEVQRRYGVGVPVSWFLGQLSVAALADRIASRLQTTHEPASAPAGGATSRVVEPGLIRLSYNQEALWFLAAMAPESVAYNLCRVLEIRGRLDVAALRRSLDLFATRHAVARTRFEVVDGLPHQAFDSSRTISFETEDLSGNDAATIAQRLSQHAWRPFDLQRDSLFRFRLLTCGEDRNLLLISVHHIVADLWSCALLVEELFAQYQALTSGRLVPLPPASTDYAEFVGLQQQMRSSPEGRALGAAWKARLSGVATETVLPTDRPRTSAQTFRGAVMEADLDEALTDRVDGMARDAGTTAFCVLLATYLVFLHRLTGQSSVAVGVPVSGRTLHRFARTVGLLANVNVIRSELSATSSWRDVLTRTTEQVRSVLDAEDYPFPLLVEELGIARDPRASPLFQQMFSLEAPPHLHALAPLVASRAGGSVSVAGLTLSSFALPQEGAQFDLHAAFVRHEGLILGNWTFNTDLLDSATVRRWSRAYMTLLREALRTPDCAAASLPVHASGDPERFPGAAGERVDIPAESTLHGCIEEQARKNPDRVAACFEENALSYATLNRRARRIARALQRRGIGPESVVGICLDRSLDLVVALLGVLKAGASYLPIATDDPAARIEQFLADAHPRLVITSELYRSKFAAAAVLASNLIDDGRFLAHGGDSGPQAAGSDNAAYVIFTSGSTGRPKAVVNTHRGIVNRVLWMQRAYRLGPEDRVLQKTPYTFDVSLWEFFWPLVAGAQLVVCRPGGHRSPQYLAQLVAEKEITVLHFVPSMLAIFLQNTDRVSLASVRAVFCSGEALQKPIEAAALTLFPGAVHNLYGPTEAAVDVTAWTCTSTDRGATVPIGSPIANTTIRILDAGFLPAIHGASGDLLIGGPSLARGYIGRPDLTAEAFVPDPYTEARGARLYQTGDRARFRADDAIEFLGRRDLQIKLRGFRVEVGEIEVHLQSHPAVAAATVVARDEPGGTRLAAYYVAATGYAESGRSLKRWLAERLPDYMIPATVVALPALPLLPTGKVDRHALAALARTADSESEDEQTRIAPRTAAEIALADTWQEILGVASVGVTDTFFDLGGDSLLIVRAVAKARERGLPVTAESIYQHQTIERICASVLDGERSGAEDAPYRPWSLVDRSHVDRISSDLEDATPLARLQEALVYHIENSENYIAYVASVTLRGPFQPDLWKRAVDVALARHAYLRISFALTRGSDALLLVHRTIDRPLFFEDIRHLAADSQTEYLAQWLSAEKKRRFAWESAPLFRLTLHRRSEDTFHLTLAEVTLDGWSIAVLLSELCRDYRTLLRGGVLDESRAPEPSYGRFVELERKAIANPASEAFWRATLSPSDCGDLPRWPKACRSTDHSLHNRRTIVGSPDLVDRLKETARRAESPLKSVLLGAHLAVLRTLTGRADVLTELITHGRLEEPGGDVAVGLYTNTVPVRVALARLRWIDVVREAYRIETEVYPHRRYPFVEIHRRWGHPQLHATAFNFTHFHVYADLLNPSPELEVLDVQSLDQTYFDLTAYFNLSPVDHRLSVDLDYNPTVLAHEQVALIAKYYERALEFLAASPEAALSESSLLPADEVVRQSEWSVGPTAEEPPDLMEVIGDRCHAHPDRVAIVHGEAAITYGDLWRQSAGLCARLRALGAGPEAGVGILLERSTDLVAAWLAVLRCGAFAVPLDLADPAERREQIVCDSRVRAIVERSAQTDERGSPHVSCTAVAAGRERTPACAGGLPDTLAYCIYTSGSTGAPKGVEVSRRALASFVQAAVPAYKLEPDDRVMQFAALTFDAALEEVCCTLSVGGTLVMRTEDALESFPAFSNQCVRDAVTVLDLPTAFWHQWTAWLAGQQQPLHAPIRTLILGGEKAVAQRLDEWRSSAGAGITVHNTYGPAEATVVAVQHAIEPTDPLEDDVPIGRPLAGMAAYVVGLDDQTGPVGRPGELCLAGRGLARGYRGRGDLTAERFRPNPFGPDAGARLYWTGDVVTWRPDGRLAFLGRKDEQIKVRGYRVELAEIERALVADPRVSQAAAISWSDAEEATTRIAAHVVPKQWIPNAAAPLATELCAALANRLPTYMVPAYIEIVPSLPLTRTGKVDKGRLPRGRPIRDRDGRRLESTTRGPVEATVCAIYRTCLHLQEVSRSARFVELGGDSLSAMRVVSRIQERLGVTFKVRDLFEARHAGDVVERVERLRQLNAGVPATLEPLIPAAPGQPLEMSYAQERLWFLHQFDPASTSYNVPAAFRIRGALNAAALHQAFIEICRRHQVLRTRFAVRGTSAVPVVPDEFVLPLRIVDLRGIGRARQDAAANAVLKREAAGPFDLEHENLVRLAIIRIEDEEYILLVLMHHIVTDEWCAHVFMDEFRHFYEAAVSGVAASLPELAVQYSDFARWQKKTHRGPRLEVLRRFWRRELAGAPPVLPLPVDVPHERARARLGERQYFEIDRESTMRLRSLADAQNASLFMVLLSVYHVLLHGVTGARDILVGSPIAGRTTIETERLVGFFANLLVLRARIRDGATFASHLATVRDTALACYDHHALSFAELVSSINPERSAAYSPVVQVIFGLWPQPFHDTRVGELRVQQQRIHGHQAKYDLEMQIAEGGDALHGFLEYDAALFFPSTIAELVSAYQRLCDMVANAPEATLHALGQTVRPASLVRAR